MLAKHLLPYTWKQSHDRSAQRKHFSRQWAVLYRHQLIRCLMFKNIRPYVRSTKGYRLTKARRLCEHTQYELGHSMQNRQRIVVNLVQRNPKTVTWKRIKCRTACKENFYDWFFNEIHEQTRKKCNAMCVILWFYTKLKEQASRERGNWCKTGKVR